MTDLPRSPFWDFSLGLYRQPGVPEACLVLQEESGVDVNMALFLLWHASEGRALDEAAVGHIDELVGAWRRDVVVKLREVRRALKPLEADPAAASLRRTVKQVELESERLQQEMLYREGAALGQPAPANAALGQANLANYAAYLGAPFDPAAVAGLVSAAF
jgi:uncharacterized protein (TIGR02444 family)